VNTKIEPKFQANMNNQISPLKNKSAIKDQKMAMTQDDNRQRYQQGPVSSHEIYEVVFEGRGE
jgi:hypothetical protein